MLVQNSMFDMSLHVLKPGWLSPSQAGANAPLSCKPLCSCYALQPAKRFSTIIQASLLPQGTLIRGVGDIFALPVSWAFVCVNVLM